MKKHVTKEVINTDFTTGEIKSSEQSFTVFNTEPEYVKSYLDALINLNRVSVVSKQVKILLELIKLMDREGEISITKRQKEKITEKIGCTFQTVKNTLSKLQQDDIITRIDKQTYMLNPKLFAKGSWSDIRKLHNKYIEMTVKFSEDGTEIESAIKNK